MAKRILSADTAGQYSVSYLTLFLSTAIIAFVLYAATILPVSWMMENPPFSTLPNGVDLFPEPTIWYYIGYGAYVIFLIVGGFFLTRFLAGRKMYFRKQPRT